MMSRFKAAVATVTTLPVMAACSLPSDYDEGTTVHDRPSFAVFLFTATQTAEVSKI